MLQVLFAILAGVLTIAAPCILPILPVLLGSSIGNTSKTRPLFIILGFIAAFTAAALVFSVFGRVLGLSQNLLRQISIGLLGLFGLFMIWPAPFELLTLRFNKLINRAGQLGQTQTGNSSGFVLGLVLGVVWTPCAGPILGFILTLIATTKELAFAGILLFFYALGAAIPMLLIAYGGQFVTTQVRLLSQYTKILQQIFGVLILALAVAMYFQFDLVIQAKLLQYYPALNPKY